MSQSPSTKTAATERVAIVTGAGRGLGRAMTLGLVQKGIRVVATAARENSELLTLVSEAKQEGFDGMVVPMLADVTREAGAQGVVAEALDRFGRLDILVNNAGRGMKYVRDSFMTEPPKFWEVDPDTWRMVMDTNINGPFLMARAAVPHLMQAGWGRIINISVSHTTMRRVGFSPYGPSKAALESETIIWAQDLRDTGVTVNSLLPGGPTLTGMVPDSISREAVARMLDPSIMVPPLLWLVSDAADAITGCRVTATQWDDANPQAAIESAGWSSAPPTAGRGVAGA